MIKLIVAAIIALAVQPHELTIAAPVMNIAPAAVNEVIVGNLPSQELSDQDPVEPAPEPALETAQIEVQETEAEEFYSEPQEEMPTPADEFAYSGQQHLGAYTITWYAREEFGYDAPGASGLGCTPGYTCAVPEYWMLGHTVLIEGYGYRLATDISPDGIVDIYVASLSEIPSYGMDYANVYLVD